MEYIVVITIIFLVLLSAPFINSILHSRKEGQVLYIEQGYVRDARYFGKSFARMVRSNYPSLDDGTVYLSKEEEFIDANTEKIHELSDEVVICLGRDFNTPDYAKVFTKEIFGEQNVTIGGNTVKVRAAYAQQKLILGNKTDIVRWIDAEETVAIYDDCDLGISASAGKKMSVGRNCTFYRLYAPEILVGQYPDDYMDAMAGRNPRMFEASENLEVKRNIKYVDKDLADENNEAQITVLTRSNISVLDNIIVKGDVRSHKNVRLFDYAAVCGNVFAEGDVYIGRNAVILGNVFAQGSVYFEEGAMVGQRGKIVSVIARDKVVFTGKSFVFGYVSCEGGGIIKVPNPTKKEHKELFLDVTEANSELIFNDLDIYEKMLDQGYRKVENLQRVVIPVGARKVSRSMFFACKSLESAELPDTIEEIDAYAFADCGKLQEFTDFAGMKLRSIGTSAFENCTALTKAEFPAELECIGAAAFAGCTSLTDVKFAEKGSLKVIEDHAFRDCSKLERVDIPDTVERIGISAFAGCDSLSYISIPEKCITEPGIEELKERPEVTVVSKEAMV